MSFLARLASTIRRLFVPPMFVVDLRDGMAHVRLGEPPAGLVAEFSAAAIDLGVKSGTIYAVKAGYGLTLEFSNDIPPHAHQRFRNLLGLHRHRIKGG